MAAAEKKWDDAGKSLYKSLTLAPYQGVGFTHLLQKNLSKMKNLKVLRTS